MCISAGFDLAFRIYQAAWVATECAHRMFKDGAANADITAMIAQV